MSNLNKNIGLKFAFDPPYALRYNPKSPYHIM